MRLFSHFLLWLILLFIVGLGVLGILYVWEIGDPIFLQQLLSTVGIGILVLFGIWAVVTITTRR